MEQAVRILGIDPGSRVTGYGIIECVRQRFQCVSAGCIRLTHLEMAQRLGQLHQELLEIVQNFSPDHCAIEDAFVDKNISSALKLGQARGAAIAAVATQGLPVYEYAPRVVKKNIVGTGAAEKTQIQHMIQVLLALKTPLQKDASDALGVAICHAHMREFWARKPQSGQDLKFRPRKKSKRWNEDDWMAKRETD